MDGPTVHGRLERRRITGIILAYPGGRLKGQARRLGRRSTDNMNLVQRYRLSGFAVVGRLKPALKALAPIPLLRWIQRQRKRAHLPPAGRVDFGDLRRLAPISRKYGYDRGRPVDRYFIEGFLARNAELIQGRVLEIGDDGYARAFGGARVTECDILHAYDQEVATIVGDLADLSNVPSGTFDCMIITQTLHLIYDVRAALSSIYRLLKPGGVLLATFPGISQISDDDWRESWYWGFTSRSATRLVNEVFPPTHTDVRAHGNVLTCAAFLFGLADRELTREELDHRDPDYELILTVRATKPRREERHALAGRWDYADAEQFAYDDEASYRKGLAFLDGHGLIEDWGCGTAHASRFVHDSPYVGIDGSESRFADTIADLQTYRSETDCIFIRHVLEHNYGWRLILGNAATSFRKRLVLIVFTPFADDEKKIGDNDGIPDLALRRDEVLAFFKGMAVTEETLESETEYGTEHIFYVERS